MGIYFAVHSAKKQLESDYTILAETLFTHPSQGFTFEHYAWAMLTISTRATDISIPGRKLPVKALVPMIDMINMAEGYSLPSTSLTTTLKGENMFEFRVEDSFAANDQILLKQSVCDNSLCFLLNHGYLPPKVERDYIPLNFIDPKDSSLLYLPILEDYAPSQALSKSLLQTKAQIVLHNQLSSARVGSAYLDSLYSMFRLLCATQKEVDEIIHLKSLSPTHSLISTSNESCAAESLLDLMESTRSSYATSLQHDELILKRVPQDEEELRLAILMRMKEKQIITDVIKSIVTKFPDLR